MSEKKSIVIDPIKLDFNEVVYALLCVECKQYDDGFSGACGDSTKEKLHSWLMAHKFDGSRNKLYNIFYDEQGNLIS